MTIAKKYICNVCHEAYPDTWEHVLTHTNPAGPNAVHAKRFKEIEGTIEPAICFCGGRVVTMGIGAEGWERSCQECNMLYDED